MAAPPASPGNGGLALPEGFVAAVLHEGVGRARHLAVTDEGIVYVKLRTAGTPEKGSSRCATPGATAAPTRSRSSATTRTPATTARRCASTTTTCIQHGRRGLPPAHHAGPPRARRPGAVILNHDYKAQRPSYEHIAKPIAFDDAGHMYVPFGAPGDVCQARNRQPGHPAQEPCEELAWHGGIWQFERGA